MYNCIELFLFTFIYNLLVLFYLNGLNNYFWMGLLHHYLFYHWVAVIWNRFAPSSDPSLSIKFYERTPEQQASLGYLVDSSTVEGTHGALAAEEAGVSDQVRREPHGSVGAAAGHRAIAQSNSAEIAEALFRYTAPEEVGDAELDEVWAVLLWIQLVL